MRDPRRSASRSHSPPRQRSPPQRDDTTRERERRRERDRDRSRDRRRHHGDRDHHSSRHNHDQFHRRHHHRSRSQHSSSQRHSHSHRPSPHQKDTFPPPLPFKPPPLSKSSLDLHITLFESYLHDVKSLSLSSLSETERKGRWKSFVGKWNRGELGEEWYHHPSLPPLSSPSPLPNVRSPDFDPRSPPILASTCKDDNNGDREDSDDGYGPTLPGQITADGSRHGPVIPTRDEIIQRNEMLETERDNALDDHRYERKTFRKSHKELLEELAPKADPGSRERKLEKKREVTEKLKAFGQDKDAGVEEVNERDLMGGDDALEELKRMKRLREQKQNQRQSKREEEEMLRRQEREERVRGYKEREAKVMEGLRGLVRERFGGP